MLLLTGLDVAVLPGLGVVPGAVAVATEAVLALLEEPESNPRKVSATFTASALRR